MRACVELQGFLGLSDDIIREIYYWLRLPPLLSACWTFLATLMESAIACWMLAAIACAGAIASRHPFDAIYALGIRRRRRTPALPRYGPPRRIETAFVGAGLVVEGWAFAAGAVWAGRVIGFAIVLVTGILAATGFCVTSYLVQRTRRRRWFALSRKP